MSSETTSVIRYERGDDAIVVLTLDDPGQSANTMNAAFRRALAAAVDRLEAEREEIAGVVVTSAKPTFLAGGDLNDLRAATKDDAADIADMSRDVKLQLRRLETLGRPVVAAIGGAALGGGLELCLACHHRIVVDRPKVRLGFPEVQLGLLPGAGGVTRAVRMLGVVDALAQLLLPGKPVGPQRARELGLVDELVETPAQLLPAARRWIEAHPDACQPWDVEGHRIPGGTPADRELAAILPTLPANLRKQLKGARYPAPHHIMAAAVEGAQVDLDSALRIEGRYFVDLVTSQVAKNMIQAFFFDMQQVTGERGRPQDAEPFVATKVVVLGAGMMGAGIAYSCAAAGIEVVLKDVSLQAAERGRSHSARLLDRAVASGRTTREQADALLARITATDAPGDAAGADLVIEAVFEDPAVKAQAFAEIEPHLADGALLGSNTSTLPIGGLADAVTRPENFIGLHFFSPVDRMPLLEIIRGKHTSTATLHRALDLSRQIRKTPIVVNDSRGFFTSRVIMTFIKEGIAMLSEGIPAATIEQASSQAGYPAPVLQLSDELNLGLIRKIRDESRAAAEAAGQPWAPHPAEQVLDRMLDDFGRAGKLAGAGFYEYEDGRRTRLWPGLRDAFAPVDDPSAIALQELGERMLFVESLETIRCLDEGVIESVADANVGSILGIGFPGWTGGVLQFVNGHEGGPAGFVARARALAAVHGERFEPPASVVEKAERGEPYDDARALVGAR